MIESPDITEKTNLLILKDMQTDTVFTESSLLALGYNITGTVLASGEGRVKSDVAPHVILVVAEKLTPVFEVAIKAILTGYAPRNIAVIALVEQQKPSYPPCYDAVLVQPAHSMQIHNRITGLTRLRRIETALISRRETLVEDFRVNCEARDVLLGVPFRILFVGSATPEFLKILNVLQEKNVEVFAAFTSFTAFDYLHDNDFDAVVLNATESLEPALSVSETMRETPRLYDVPTLVMANKTNADIGEAAIKKGARDVFYASASQYEIAGRILELANFHRIHSALKKELAEIDTIAGLDAPTQLYNREFLHANLARVSAYHAQIGETVSLLMLRIRPVSMDVVGNERITAALDQIGSKLKSLVRAEDLVARVRDDVFAVAFPGQAKASVQVVGQRIKEVIDSAVFKSRDTQGGPLTLEAEFLLSEKLPHESSDTFIVKTEQELMGSPSDFRIAN